MDRLWWRVLQNVVHWRRVWQTTSVFLSWEFHEQYEKAMLSKSLIQFSINGQGCVPALLFDLRPNYGGGNEDHGYLLQKIPCTYCYIQCPQSCSRPLLTQASAGDSWTLAGRSGSVSCGVTAPFSCVLVHKVLLVPSKSLFPSPVKWRG